MLAEFALRLICGMSLMWSLMPRREVTSGFFRIQMLVVMALAVLASLTFGRFVAETAGDAMSAGTRSATGLSVAAGRALCGVLAGTAFLGSVLWTLERRRAGEIAALAIAGLSAVTLLAATLPFRAGDAAGLAAGGPLLLRGSSELSSAGVLGGAVTGMLLGHWYLTAPTMSIAPLGRLNGLFAAAVGSRLVLSAVGAGIAWTEIVGRNDWMLWLVLRWAAGIVGPLCLAAMVWRILKHRNTQSATGVLFAATILVFLGELTASLLAGEVGVPL